MKTKAVELNLKELKLMHEALMTLSGVVMTDSPDNALAKIEQINQLSFKLDEPTESLESEHE